MTPDLAATTDRQIFVAQRAVPSWPLVAQESSTRNALCVPVGPPLVLRASSIRDRLSVAPDVPVRTLELPRALVQTSPPRLPFEHWD